MPDIKLKGPLRIDVTDVPVEDLGGMERDLAKMDGIAATLVEKKAFGLSGEDVENFLAISAASGVIGNAAFHMIAHLVAKLRTWCSSAKRPRLRIDGVLYVVRDEDDIAQVDAALRAALERHV